VNNRFQILLFKFNLYRYTSAAATAAMMANVGALTSNLKKYPRPSSAPVMRKVNSSQRIALLHGPGGAVQVESSLPRALERSLVSTLEPIK
jgi:hypothetical protein